MMNFHVLDRHDNDLAPCIHSAESESGSESPSGQLASYLSSVVTEKKLENAVEASGLASMPIRRSPRIRVIIVEMAWLMLEKPESSSW
jgi:hypothetical protein